MARKSNAEHKVRFLTDYRVKPDGPDYQAGQIVGFERIESALHFVNRQVAEHFDGPLAQPADAPEEAEAPEAAAE